LDAVGADEVRSWYEADEDNQLAMAGDFDGFRRSCDEFGANLSLARAEDMAGGTRSEADRAYLRGEHADWLASCLREAFVSGSSGCADDTLAFLRDWGFSLQDARRVAIWHGDDDQNVPVVHGRWLADHLPAAELKVVENEGHVSIGRHFLEILDHLTSDG
jgi:pimeloyl-ACP methyl ester carboxylesterase